MSHAQTCPICEGRGTKTEARRWEDGDGRITYPRPLPCHGCGGKGWVTVEDGQHIRVVPATIPIIEDPDKS